MQNKIIKIIAFILAGLTLSACLGGITLPTITGTARFAATEEREVAKNEAVTERLKNLTREDLPEIPDTEMVKSQTQEDSSEIPDTGTVTNLTLADLPKIPAIASIINGSSFPQYSTDSPNGVCLENPDICLGVIPTAIDIKPLIGNNAGMATYRGTLNMSYLGTSRAITITNEAIDITVDFDSDRLLHNGLIEGNSFSINGNFDARGKITGTVSLESSQGSLIGLIGQTKMIGIFGENDRNWYGGGFTANRIGIRGNPVIDTNNNPSNQGGVGGNNEPEDNPSNQGGVGGNNEPKNNPSNQGGF